MNRKTFLTIALTICGVLLMGCGAYFAYRSYKPKSDGSINIKVVELDNSIIKQKTIEYKNGDTLVGLVSSNFNNVKIENGMVMSIERLSTPNDWSTYICIYINDKISNFGINDIRFNNGYVISFVNTINNWNE